VTRKRLDRSNRKHDLVDARFQPWKRYLARYSLTRRRAYHWDQFGMRAQLFAAESTEQAARQGLSAGGGGFGDDTISCVGSGVNHDVANRHERVVYHFGFGNQCRREIGEHEIPRADAGHA